MKPTKKQVEKWSAALRSGEYKQTYGTLQDSEGYCCLGVACRLFIPSWKQKGKIFLTGAVPDDQPNAPFWLIEVNRDFYLKSGITLMQLNDQSPRYSFNEIADLLELVYIHKALD